MGQYLRYFGIWEPNLTGFIKRRLSTGDVFLDIGAHIGYFTLLAAKIVGDTGTVIAIEPFPDAYALLVSNITAAGCRNVRPINAAAWDDRGTVTLRTTGDTVTGMSTISADWATYWEMTETSKVKAIPAFELLDKDDVIRTRLVKIDVEGSEWRVLRGLEPLLRDGRDDLELIVEINPHLLKTADVEVDTLTRYLADYGFEPHEVENDYSVTAYLGRPAPLAPTRILAVPPNRRQIDVVFSRADEPRL